MDYVINHSAAQHPLFLQASKGRDNRWRDWYVWRTDAPPGWNIWDAYPWYDAATKPWLSKQEPKHMPRPAPGATNLYFATFGPHMPDFNLRNPEVVDYHLASLRFWLNRGLDGYRLDAVPHMIENDAEHWNDQPESRALTRRLQQEIKRYPHRYVVCEATAEPAAYGDPAVCGGAFAFGYVQHFVEAARGKAESVQRLASHYRQASPTMATFLSNHDIFTGGRLWDQLGGDLARYRVAAAAYLLQPGTPFIYFGEEIGQAGVASLPADQPVRSPMSWTAEGGFSTGQPFRPVSPNAGRFNVADELHDPRSLHAFYKAMLGLRNSRPSIARGSFESSFADGLVLGFQRRLGSERSLVLVNYDTRAAIVTVPGLSPQDRLAPLYPKAAEAPTSNTLTLAPQSVQVFDIR
jgi:glycosidase